jgi:transketolase
VTVVGIGGGVTYSTLGGTHHAQEDVSVACSIPHMSVIAPCDPAETEAATRWCAQQETGPVYLRLGKAGEPDLSAAAKTQWAFGKIRELRQGSDVCILSYGPITKKAFEVADAIGSRGRSAAIYSVHTLKPLDREGLRDVLARYPHVILIEECAPSGSLAMRVKELAWETQARCRLDTFSLQDDFIHCYGSHDDLLSKHGLSTEAVCHALAPAPQ